MKLKVVNRFRNRMEVMKGRLEGGTFILKQVLIDRNKYKPHQGEKEKARRLKKRLPRD